MQPRQRGALLIALMPNPMPTDRNNTGQTIQNIVLAAVLAAAVVALSAQAAAGRCSEHDVRIPR